MAHEISTGKSICILGTVIACFAVLWPNIFYPMLKGSVSVNSDGCCDVLLDKDVHGVKLVNELCTTVLKSSDKYSSNFYFSTNRLNKDAVKYCRNVVLETCDIDINALLKDTIALDVKYKNVLFDIRTFNKSLCLKYHFDITLDLLGTPHRVKKFNITTPTNYYRQERKSKIKPEALHPAFRKTTPPVKRERIEEDIIYHDEEISPPITTIQHEVMPGKKPPVPGMRPTVGGSGYVANQKGSGTMGILMPMYTIAIVAFFTYTILRLLSKKPENHSNFTHDPDFCKNVFSSNDYQEKTNSNNVADPASKLVVTALSSLLQEVNRDILEREKIDSKDEADLKQPIEAPVSSNDTQNVIEKNQDEPVTKKIVQEEHSEKSEKLNGVIKVVGMELNESCENGQPWKKSLSPSPSKPTPIPETPQEILLSGNVPVNSEILVSDAHTENVATESSVILESKVTLNVISPDIDKEKANLNREKSQINSEKSIQNGTEDHNGRHSSPEEEEEEEEIEVEEEEEEEVEEIEEVEEEEEEEEVEEVEEEEDDDEGEIVIELEGDEEEGENGPAVDYDNNEIIIGNNEIVIGGNIRNNGESRDEEHTEL